MLIDTVYMKRTEIEVHAHKDQCVVITGDLKEHAQSLILTKENTEELIVYLTKAVSKITDYEIEENNND